MKYNKSIELYNDGIGKVEYVDHMGNDLTIVNSARVSFGDHKEILEEKDIKLIKYLIKHKHTSTLEHCVVTFRCIVPLFVRSQHHRHRMASYNEISRRYTSKDMQFYEPKTFRTQHESNRQASNINDQINPQIFMEPFNSICSEVEASEVIKKHNKISLELYNELVKSGICREQARGVLPQNLYTEYYCTVNLNNLLKFIDLREHEGAQWEIQQVARAFKEICEDLFPQTLKAYGELK